MIDWNEIMPLERSEGSSVATGAGEMQAEPVRLYEGIMPPEGFSHRPSSIPSLGEFSTGYIPDGIASRSPMSSSLEIPVRAESIHLPNEIGGNELDPNSYFSFYWYGIYF